MFKGKTVLIAGGSEGIGFSISELLVTQGANVFIASRSIEKLDRALDQLKKYKTEDQFLQSDAVDVSNYSEVREWVQEKYNNTKDLSAVINCAGFAHPGYIQDISADDFKKMMEVNYLGVVHTSKAASEIMAEQKRGHILNTSSIAGFLGLFGYTGYCGSKFAVIGFSEALMRELKPLGVTVSVLCPPNTNTPGLSRENQIKPKEVLATEEKAKTVSPEFVAKETLNGMKKNKFLIVPTLDGSMAYYLNRLSPKFINLFIGRKSFE